VPRRAPAAAGPDPDRVAAVREFNRFYTRRVGALREGLLDTSHPLPEARVLFELGRGGATQVAELRDALDLDAGYLSRLLASLERAGLVERERSAADARRQVARLTRAGMREYRTLDRRSAREVGALLAGHRSGVGHGPYGGTALGPTAAPDQRLTDSWSRRIPASQRS
jgi:DNA-binding MarR family transcriptional regulator